MFAGQRMDGFLAGLAGNIGLHCTHYWLPTALAEMTCRSLEPLWDEHVSEQSVKQERSWTHLG